ncbi:MAG: 16S rRNA (adenine(1518)-N(6)/adenine(1519)-N(6))-dimethyltransferase RsmA [Candidatus Omnitrophica bacterium]|nr:16S rRNA (adenine(1518)-N(6)/adenine(1519)-N(6))-dimethyltransferase RsmA [Candidatus Omnitrophota bacterium]MDD5352586.1 16S rRNA (adenine(1518)-N(6)/adenine(1519)-N(6))-dimethyltransferase RsmA [Candidatus Omnitrophota bacterium]MDD5550184.1 16S rRNA (adenine(1518)-N(6)/adenine(1519)-N(6))-dimethyltransferase RsmA [Candidatus Omnitrophota bacterium]
MLILPLDFYPKKRFGQSFLTDKNIIRKILARASLSKDDVVLEIGPGQGILTGELAGQVKKVIAVELDKKLYEHLGLSLRDFHNIDLINSDILEFNLGGFLKKSRIKKKIKLVGNIPYSITTPILEYVFENIDLLESVYLMVQKEFALRLIAKPNTKDYSSISCFTQFHTKPTLLFSVNRTCFKPQPKVDSSFIKLEPRPKGYWLKELKLKDRKLLFKIIRAAFNQRRKNILNSLSSVLDKDSLSGILSKLNIDHNLRAENLSIEDYTRISNLCFDCIKDKNNV